MARVRRIALTGANGYLGGRLRAWLAARGDEVVAIEGDVREGRAMAAAFERAGTCDGVLHLAGASDAKCAENVALAMDVNVLGAAEAMLAAVASGTKRFVYFSTIHAYGEPAIGSTVSEAATVPCPLHPYGISKWAGEQLCRGRAVGHGAEVAILRVANGVGAPASHGTRTRASLLMLDLCKQAHENKSLTLRSPGTQRRDFVAIDDVAQAASLLVDCDASALRDPVFNVGSGVSTAVRELAAIVQREHELLYGEKIPLYFPEPERPIDAPFTLSIAKLRALGYAPTTDLAAEARHTLRFFEALRR